MISMSALLVAAFCGSLTAQIEIPATDQLKASDCTPELFDIIEKEYRRSDIDFNAAYRAEKRIRKVLAVCPSADFNPSLYSKLETLEEEHAYHFFLLAKFYFDQSQKGGRGLKGAQSRFLEIVDKYPHYSRIDEVLFLLSETYEFEDNYDEAEKSLQKLIDDSPSGVFRSNAEVELQQIRTKRLVLKAVEGS